MTVKPSFKNTLNRIRWGRWRLKDTSTLCIPDGGYFSYDIELSRLSAHWKVLHWVNHLTDKDWISKEDISWFITACRELRYAGYIQSDPGSDFDEYSEGC